LPKPVVAIIQRHVGGGITANEAKALGRPNDDVYVPSTLEEKVVSYADKLIENGKRVPVDRAIEQLHRELKPEAADRVRKLHEEIAALIGDCP
jgi:enoyl-CoA hydratase/carnithine racemase